MKKIYLFVNIILMTAILASCILLPSHAAENSGLTETDAKELVLKAFQFYYKYQFSEVEITIAREDISREARRIYVEEIADDMWMKRCYGSKERRLYNELSSSLKYIQNGVTEVAPEYYEIAVNYYKNQLDQLFGNGGLTFTDNADGTVTILPFAKSIMDWRQFHQKEFGILASSSFGFWDFVVSTEYSSDFYSEKIRPHMVTDIITRNFTSDLQYASAQVLIYHVKEEGNRYYEPVWVPVNFSNTSYGWRISGGDLALVLSDWSSVSNNDFQSDVTTPNSILYYGQQSEGIMPVSVSNHLMRYVACRICQHAAGTGQPDAVYTGAYQRNVEAGEFKLLYQDKNKAVYLIECIPVIKSDVAVRNRIGEEHGSLVILGESKGLMTAEFTYDPDYTYIIPHSLSETVTGAWRLTGGDWYDIATGKFDTDNAPNTGDDRLITFFSLCIASFVCAAVSFWIAVNRRKRDV